MRHQPSSAPRVGPVWINRSAAAHSPHPKNQPFRDSQWGTEEGRYREILLWLQKHRLGRKRLVDAQLEAACSAAGVTRLLAWNLSDIEILEVFRPGSFF